MILWVIEGHIISRHLYIIIYSLLGKQTKYIKKDMEENIDMNWYLQRHGTQINIGFTFNNKTHWFMHAEHICIYSINK